MTYEPHHEGSAPVTLGGRVECLHHKLMCFGLWRINEISMNEHQSVIINSLFVSRLSNKKNNNRLTFGEERPILPYPPERMVGVWTVRGGWSINCMTEHTHKHQAVRFSNRSRLKIRAGNNFIGCHLSVSHRLKAMVTCSCIFFVHTCKVLLVLA